MKEKIVLGEPITVVMAPPEVCGWVSYQVAADSATAAAGGSRS